MHERREEGDEVCDERVSILAKDFGIFHFSEEKTVEITGA